MLAQARVRRVACSAATGRIGSRAQVRRPLRQRLEVSPHCRQKTLGDEKRRAMPLEHRTARHQCMRRHCADLTRGKTVQRMPRGHTPADQRRARDAAVAIQQFGERPGAQTPRGLPHAHARGERRDAVRCDERHAIDAKHDLAHPYWRTHAKAQRGMFVGPRQRHALTGNAHGDRAKHAQMRGQRTAAGQPVFLRSTETRQGSDTPVRVGGIKTDRHGIGL